MSVASPAEQFEMLMRQLDKLLKRNQWTINGMESMLEFLQHFTTRLQSSIDKAKKTSDGQGPPP